jgi:type II secretory pathway pseudopilin PulG
MLERCVALRIGERCCPARDLRRAFLRIARPVASRRDRQRGFTYIGLLFIVMAFGAGLAGVSLVWHTAARRDKEAELLFVGKQYRQAIASYYASGQREFPARLEDLLLDPRFPSVKRHLRRLYPDPLTGASEWGLVKLGERIVGVYSLAPGTPLREAPGEAGDPPLGGSSYGDWKFVVDPTTQGQAAAAPDPRATLRMPATPPAPQASDYKSTVADDPCEREQEAAIAQCGGDDPTQNPEFQACVMVAFEAFLKCKGGS